MFKAALPCLFCFALGLVATANARQTPHIILVMADDQGYGDTGFTGHPFVQTPNLNAMASEGVVFNRFYASAPNCSPTRASVMTGRHPYRGNVLNHGHYLRPNESTIAEALHEAGYVTGHFGKWHIGSVQRESPTCPGGQGFDEWLSGLNFFDNDPYLSRNGRFEQIIGSGTEITMDATLDFLSRHSQGDRPMFVVTWFPSPHSPHQEIPRNVDKADQLYSDQKTAPGYFREITLLDQQVGRLRQALRDLKIEKETLFFYCSDNGGLVEKSSGGRAKKGSVYEGGLRVPAILQWPAKYQPHAIDVPVYASDLYPTLLSIAGVALENQTPLDGVDLTEILSGASTDRPAMGFWHGFQQGQATYSDRVIKTLMEAQRAGKPNPHPERVFKNVREFPTPDKSLLSGHAAWNEWPWKLHRIQSKGGVKVELYHLEQDPMETNDLSGDQPQRVARMQDDLEQWQRSVLDSWSGKDYTK